MTASSPENELHLTGPLKKKKIELFETWATTGENRATDGSAFFVKHRLKFPILYQVFASNRVICQSNSMMESWFSQASNAITPNRTNLSPVKADWLMRLKSSPFYTPSLAVRVGAQMPSPRVAPSTSRVIDLADDE